MKRLAPLALALLLPACGLQPLYSGRDGVLSRVTIAAGDTSLAAVITTSSANELALQPGAAVIATIKATAVHIC